MEIRFLDEIFPNRFRYATENSCGRLDRSGGGYPRLLLTSKSDALLNVYATCIDHELNQVHAAYLSGVNCSKGVFHCKVDSLRCNSAAKLFEREIELNCGVQIARNSNERYAEKFASVNGQIRRLVPPGGTFQADKINFKKMKNTKVRIYVSVFSSDDKFLAYCISNVFEHVKNPGKAPQTAVEIKHFQPKKIPITGHKDVIVLTSKFESTPQVQLGVKKNEEVMAIRQLNPVNHNNIALKVQFPDLGNTNVGSEVYFRLVDCMTSLCSEWNSMTLEDGAQETVKKQPKNDYPPDDGDAAAAAKSSAQLKTAKSKPRSRQQQTAVRLNQATAAAPSEQVVFEQADLQPGGYLAALQDDNIMQALENVPSPGYVEEPDGNAWASSSWSTSSQTVQYKASVLPDSCNPPALMQAESFRLFDSNMESLPPCFEGEGSSTVGFDDIVSDATVKPKPV